jgi:hypothetical protein
VSLASTDKKAFFKRRVQLKWVLVLVAVMLVIMVTIVVVLVLVDRDRDEDRRQAAATTTSSPPVTSPYDFSELPADTDLAALGQVAFVSILAPNDQGDATSYGISSDLPAAQALSEAIRNAAELDSNEAAALTAALAGAMVAGNATPSTITFVFADRGTLTFVLNLDLEIVTRGERAWRPDGDLRALVEAALMGNQ